MGDLLCHGGLSSVIPAHLRTSDSPETEVPAMLRLSDDTIKQKHFHYKLKVQFRSVRIWFLRFHPVIQISVHFDFFLVPCKVFSYLVCERQISSHFHTQHKAFHTLAWLPAFMPAYSIQ